MQINRAILKYGYSNFSLIILEYCSPDKCIEREYYYINLFESEYNTIKNPTLPPMSGRKHSEKTKTIMSEANKGEKNPNYGKNHSDESKQKISDALTGSKRSDDTRKNMSDAHKGKTHSEETKQKNYTFYAN